MSVKVYIKQGKKNYKEEKLLKPLQKAIEKKIEQDPEFGKSYKPAKSFEELQGQFNEYCIEDVDFKELPDNGKTNNSTESFQQNDGKDSEETFSDIQGTKDPKPIELSEDEGSVFVDPMNREEPLVRDYVLKSEFPEENQPQGPQKTYFEEPTSFRDSFDLADDETGAEGGGTASGQSGEKKSQQNKAEPINPQWDEMSNAKKKKSTKKFAKYIVEAVCVLAEKGFVWFANKDINAAKLAQYEINQEMDLDLLVTLENGQEATIKEFFTRQCFKAQELAVIPSDQKEDLADALTEVLMEKGVGPTPTQELLLITLTIFGGQAMNLMAIKAQNDGLLAQLRAMKKEEMGTIPPPRREAPQAPVQPQEQPQAQQEPQTQQYYESTNEPEAQETGVTVVQQEGNFTMLEAIENPEPTQE